ncbi:MAG TPA: hypothetical protein VGS12_18765 [Caulobacteraceae bacterium]|nr:hypothetical protein [Caulobacteraceae bacterium]
MPFDTPESAADSFWTPRREARAVSLWRAGASAGEIAAILAAPSKTAVIACISRLGVARTSAERRRFRGPRLPAPEPLRSDPPSTLARAPRPWLTRREGECAFPVAGRGMRVLSCCNACGAARYCPAHAALARRGVGDQGDCR